MANGDSLEALGKGRIKEIKRLVDDPDTFCECKNEHLQEVLRFIVDCLSVLLIRNNSSPIPKTPQEAFLLVLAKSPTAAALLVLAYALLTMHDKL